MSPILYMRAGLANFFLSHFPKVLGQVTGTNCRYFNLIVFHLGREGYILDNISNNDPKSRKIALLTPFIVLGKKLCLGSDGIQLALHEWIVPS